MGRFIRRGSNDEVAVVSLVAFLAIGPASDMSIDNFMALREGGGSA